MLGRSWWEIHWALVFYSPAPERTSWFSFPTSPRRPPELEAIPHWSGTGSPHNPQAPLKRL